MEDALHIHTRHDITCFEILPHNHEVFAVSAYRHCAIAPRVVGDAGQGLWLTLRWRRMLHFFLVHSGILCVRYGRRRMLRLGYGER
jgi:hypothetical protein